MSIKFIIKKMISLVANNFKLCRIKKKKYSTLIDRGLIINGKLRENIYLGKKVYIGRNARLGNTGSKDNKIVVEDGCYIQNYFTAIDGNIIIHKNCLLASNVSLLAGNHSYDFNDNFQTTISGTIEIGEHSWIGEHVIVLKDVTIGERCIIGAGSVVTKSIPSYSIAVGNPAVVIKKYNFETKQYEKI